jgi:hypothetical protein
MGLTVWCEDEAGPFQAIPHPGSSWQPEGRPATQPHEYVRGGTIKILTLFHPATGQVRVRPVASTTNAILHGWLRETLEEIMAALPAAEVPSDPTVTRALWQAWQDGALHLARTTPTLAAPAGVGQPRWSQDSGDGRLAVSAWHYAALHAVRRKLAEHG